MTRAFTIVLIAVCCLAVIASAYPSRNEDVPARRSLRSRAAPQKGPTAIARGYASTSGGSEDEPEEQEEPEAVEHDEEEPEQDEEEEATPAPVRPTRPSRPARPVRPVKPVSAKPVRPVRPVRPTKPVDNEEEEEQDSPKARPAIRAIATSVANGPGAVSKSHALAIDGPLPSGQYRNRNRY